MKRNKIHLHDTDFGRTATAAWLAIFSPDVLPIAGVSKKNYMTLWEKIEADSDVSKRLMIELETIWHHNPTPSSAHKMANAFQKAKDRLTNARS